MRQAIWICCALLGFSAALASAYFKFGWIPGDDGTLAAGAARVLHGQLPHRDFVENYTGGLNYIHGAAFRIFGMNLAAMRIPVFCLFLCWVPAVFYVAWRIAPPWGAASATLLCVVWSLPNYPTPMPSWYNLFLATFGIACLFRYLETRHKRWLYAAGLLAGASFLIKIVGLYFVGAVLLFLVFREQTLNHSSQSEKVSGALLYRIFMFGSLLMFLCSVLYLIHPHGSGRIIHFVIPVGAVTAVLVARERRPSPGESWQRFACLFGMIVPFLVGMLAPVGVFLAPYFVSGSVGTFLHGVFGIGMARVSGLAVYDPPSAIGFIIAIPPLVALWIGFSAKPRAALMASAVVAVLEILLLAISGKYELMSQLVFESALMLAPICVVVGAVGLASESAAGMGAVGQQRLMLLLGAAALCALVQFPFAAPIYFCYYAPLLILAMFAVISSWQKSASVPMLCVVLGFYFLFAAVRMNPTRIYRFSFTHPAAMSRLSLPEAGGLLVPSPETYETMVAMVRSHSTNNQVLAFPECPEVYFLTGLENPTRDDSGARADDVYRVLASNEINVVVIDQKPYFAASKPTPEVMAAIERAFPQSSSSGKYLVRWRR